MKLYAFPPSPRSRKCIAAAMHLGFPVEVVSLDLMKGEHKSPDMMELNPNGRLPVAMDGDFALWESAAILKYMADKAGQLVPGDSKGQALVNQWLSWEQSTYDPACMVLLFERLIKKLRGAGEPDTTRVAEGLDKFRQAATVLDTHLAGQDYVVRNTLSIVDFSLAAPLFYQPMVQFPLDDFKNIRRWYANIENIDAWQRSAPRLPESA
jgi:glutathione S-transferase